VLFSRQNHIIMTYRENGISALQTVLSSEKNIGILDKNIFLKSTDEESYNRIIFQTIGDVINNVKLPEILKNIKKGSVEWVHPTFIAATNQMAEQDDFIEHPFEVEEGVIECKCGSKRVFSYSKQVRSADEPMSTFAHCVKCNKKWTYSG
jgi:DNA-directed RNA polymerase subunit M/transcription elongation factor TFIIS